MFAIERKPVTKRTMTLTKISFLLDFIEKQLFPFEGYPTVPSNEYDYSIHAVSSASFTEKSIIKWCLTAFSQLKGEMESYREI